MAMIKRADFEQYARDAYVMDLSDLEKRGRAVVDAATAQAEQILRRAQAKRDQMLSTASQEGHEQGYAEGLSEGRDEGIRQGTEEARAQHGEQLAQLLSLWTEQLDAFESQRDTMLEQARTQVVELAAMVARRVVRRAVELDPAVVLGQVEAVLSSVTESTRLVLSVHPDDAEFVRAELPGMVDRFAGCEHAQVVTDASLARGSCIARTPGGGTIDASISTQIERIVEALLPGGEQAVVNPQIAIADEPADLVDENPGRSQEDAA